MNSAWVEAKLQQELRADRLPACLIVGKVESRDNIPPGVTECMSRFVHVYESVARMYAESEVDATRASACENATRASVYDAMRASECDATRASVNNAMRANVSDATRANRSTPEGKNSAWRTEYQAHFQRKLVGFVLQRIHWVQDFLSIVAYANNRGVISEEKKRRTFR